MIVRMQKVYIAVRRDDRQRLLEQLASMGVVHVQPVEPARVEGDAELGQLIEHLKSAIQVCQGIGTDQKASDGMNAAEWSRDINEIQQRSARHESRLVALHREMEQLGHWRDVSLEKLDQLREAGVELHLYSVPSSQVGEMRAACVEELQPLPGKHVLVAVADRGSASQMPATAKLLPPPSRSADAIRREAGEIEGALQQDAQRLRELAATTDEMKKHVEELCEQADYARAQQSGVDHEHLFAVQGWIPSMQESLLAGRLAEGGLVAAVRMLEPAIQEDPPTLIRYPRWARPIEGLFNLLGVVPGYREFDLSAAFMIALPIFAAMLISDGGYGLLLCVIPLLAYGKVSRTLGVQFTRLLIVIGVASCAWGVLCGSYFGAQFYEPPIPVDLTESSRRLVMIISFCIGAVHLSLAQLWRAVGFYPNLRFLNRVGWAVLIWGMLGTVLYFVLRTPMGWNTPWPYLLIVGLTMAILFAAPQRNVLRLLMLGIADVPLSLLSAFSDVISYVRLMAVGLASSVLATSFNDMAAQSGHWTISVAILVFGHGLNIGLAMVALFAHGVRLNMLEFSNNLGMQWTGYPYRPLAKRTMREYVI